MKEESITRITLEEIKDLEDLTDWERLKNISEAEAEQNALSDRDNQPLLRKLKRVNRAVSPSD